MHRFSFRIFSIIVTCCIALPGLVAASKICKNSQIHSIKVYHSPEEGGPRNLQVTQVTHPLPLYDKPSPKAKVIHHYAASTLLDNLGCQLQQDQAWCDVQQLGGGPRGYVMAKFLTPATSPDGSIALGPDNSALRAGQHDFDATGTLPCAFNLGQPMTTCQFGVSRAQGGYATVVVFKPNQTTRAIYFRMGQPIGADLSQADGNITFSSHKESDLHFIRAGYERYEIPEAIIFGD